MLWTGYVVRVCVLHVSPAQRHLTFVFFSYTAQDLNWDICFLAPSQGNVGYENWFNRPLGIAGESFSLGFWFRFQPGATGTVIVFKGER